MQVVLSTNQGTNYLKIFCGEKQDTVVVHTLKGCFDTAKYLEFMYFFKKSCPVKRKSKPGRKSCVQENEKLGHVNLSSE